MLLFLLFLYQIHLKTQCSCHFIGSILYVDFLEKKIENLTNFDQQVDERIIINVVDFQNIQNINLRTSLKTLSLFPMGK